ncbi:Bcr/CflA family drug resistance efflux transporter [Campylobacter sp. MIT 99-7217]|uniref:multidrug effflux MFS transporter n=1 Tax=Campylobacter sp. MIT 99-7217 TaxID=535091 RepID=UPI001157321C|nr:multidrug effflux MFS transporter [Campylobacter sp. MIT 99-7217]TQR32348.1 Bcr/CflA family drug resistance efflux transporter [Campylobacter sp. MIT 99-7217]
MQQHTKISGFAKYKTIFILAFMSSIAPLSTDMYLPALGHVRQSFETSEFLTQLSLASFFIAFALGQLIYGPLSDIFGRKKPLYFGVALFILSSLGCFLVDNIYIFILLRFFEALGGCAGVVIARAIVNDLFEVREAAGVFALMMVVSSVAPMLSPTFGALLLDFFSWHSIFATLFILGLALYLLIIFALKESSVSIKKEKLSNRQILKNYALILKDRAFMVYVLSATLAMSAMFAYITGSSFVFIEFFSLSSQTYGILFGVNALGFVIFANINAPLALKFSPEKILPKAFIFIFLFSLLVFIFGLLENFWLFEISIFFTIAMLGFLLPNTTTLAMARFKEHSGVASAVLGCIQFGFAGAISFVVSALNANNPIWLGSIICLCCFIGVLVFFLFKAKE